MLTRLPARMAFAGAALKSGFAIVRLSQRGIEYESARSLAHTAGYGKSTRSS
jgi:hypothetical protein